MINLELVRRFAAHRKENPESIKDLACKIGIDRSTLGKFINGLNVGQISLLKIEKYLGHV